MAQDVIYRRHIAAENFAFRSPQGMTGRWTRAKAEEVAAHARLLAPKPGQGRGYASGETALSIRAKGAVVGRKGPEATVSSNTDHAVFVHEGTSPHTIRPKFANKLVFFWRKAGRVVTLDKVHHPGTKANRFLLNALRAVFGGPGR